MQLEDDNHQLRRQNAELKFREEELQAAVARLQIKVQSHTRDQHQSASSLERIQLLETQLVMYHEDFQTERRDRERAQSKLQELEQQLETLRRQKVMMYLMNCLEYFYFASKLYQLLKGVLSAYPIHLECLNMKELNNLI